VSKSKWDTFSAYVLFVPAFLCFFVAGGTAAFSYDDFIFEVSSTSEYLIWVLGLFSFVLGLGCLVYAISAYREYVLDFHR
jgi:hypothetical protein